MAYAPADVLYIDCDRNRLHGSDPKPKYLVCVDPGKRLFFFINSEPFRKLMDTQVPITPKDLGCLTNPVSYIDTRNLISFRYNEIDPQIRSDPSRVVGALPEGLIDKVKNAALESGLLNELQEEILRKNF